MTSDRGLRTTLRVPLSGVVYAALIEAIIAALIWALVTGRYAFAVVIAAGLLFELFTQSNAPDRSSAKTSAARGVNTKEDR